MVCNASTTLHKKDIEALAAISATSGNPLADMTNEQLDAIDAKLDAIDANRERMDAELIAGIKRNAKIEDYLSTIKLAPYDLQTQKIMQIEM